MDWRISAARDVIKALIPFQHHIRQAKRRLIPYQPDPANFSLTLKQGLEQISLIRSAGRDIDGTVLEIGAGWVPIIPLLYVIAGGRKPLLLDLERLMDQNTIDIAKDYLREQRDTICSALKIPPSRVDALLAEAFSPDYRVPGLVSDVESQSVDLVVSRAVLEHVKPAELDPMLQGVARVLKPNGLVCFTIDNSDHWQHRDKSISRVNFLKYEDDWRWRLTSLNRQNYQNRYRHSDYAEIFRRFRFEILAEKREVNDEALATLANMTVAARFRSHSHDDLATITSVFLLRPLSPST